MPFEPSALRSAGFKEGDVLLLGSISPDSGVSSESATTDTFERVTAAGINRFDFQTIVPEPSRLRFSVSGRFLPGTDETYDVRLRNTDGGGRTLMDITVTESDEMMAEWQDPGLPSGAGFAQVELEHRTTPAVNTSTVQQPISWMGYEL